MEELNTHRRSKPEQINSSKETINPEHFVYVSVYKYVAVIFGMSMFAFLCFHPSPQTYLSTMGGPGARLQYLRDTYLMQMRIGFFLAVLLHIGEALYAVKLASQLKLTQEATNKWVMQTGIIGYASLQELIKYGKTVESGKKK